MDDEGANVGPLPKETQSKEGDSSGQPTSPDTIANVKPPQHWFLRLLLGLPDSIEATCATLQFAFRELNTPMGSIVAAHQELIVGYYKDVRKQANMSFVVATGVAIIGFVFLMMTLNYALAAPSGGSLTVTRLGFISGALSEFIAGCTFVIYARCAKQFNAFHICLERTHRYLLTYLIASQEKDRDAAHELIIIMAKAPMIIPPTSAPLDLINLYAAIRNQKEAVRAARPIAPDQQEQGSSPNLPQNAR
jgi:hypothetical protein